jgi:hypothetical protein
MTVDKRYIGDGVYASFDGYHVVVNTDNAIIYLDDLTMASLMGFAREHFPHLSPKVNEREGKERAGSEQGEILQRPGSRTE